MLARIADNISTFFVDKNVIKEDEKEVYTYGYEVLLSEAINWGITLIIAILTRTYIETAIYMLFFVSVRVYAGGFHAKTHMGCITLSTFIYAISLLLIQTVPIGWYLFIIPIGLLAHLISVFVFSPLEHENKPFELEEDRIRCRKKSIVLTVVYGVLIIASMFTPWQFIQKLGFCGVLGLLSASLALWMVVLPNYLKGKKI